MKCTVSLSKHNREKEKSLLEERVSARRETEDRITQEEEKAELERQLAMVEMDSTRTKDAAALREQIANLDKELNRAAEDDLIASQQAMMDDEIAAIDDMLESGSQELETFLADANNFSTELNSILELGQDDLLSWLKENVVAFKESTDAAQQQMINSWKDTYEQFKNITENYQERINEIMSSKDKFLAAMEQTDEYQKADEVTRESMRYEWSTMYDDMINAQIDSNYEWSHTDGNEKTDTTAEINETSLKIYNSTYEIENYTAKIAKILEELSKNSVTQYATGGLVDYTGYAWVDGSPSKPEYVLSANQWADFSEMIDSSKFSYIPDRINYSGTGFDASSISMVNNITINQASISDSMDIAELAQQVGEEFSKSLSLNGFNTRFNI